MISRIAKEHVTQGMHLPAYTSVLTMDLSLLEIL